MFFFSAEIFKLQQVNESMKLETHYSTHVLSEVWFFHLGVNVVFSARQNHLVKLKNQH